MISNNWPNAVAFDDDRRKGKTRKYSLPRTSC